MNLPKKYRRDRLRMCQENLAKVEGGTWRLTGIVIGDEAWLY
jgi:hypothetical protein